MQPRNISVVTTCKGRLHHLQQTLPLLVAQAPAEIIVVDYGCPDNAGDWVALNYPDVIVVKVSDDNSFCAARARNLGANASSSSWIFFVDADVKVSAKLFEWMSMSLDSRFFYRAGSEGRLRKKDTWGTFICSKKAFEEVSGYDEVFRGWGGEDDDIYRRLINIKVMESDYPGEYVVPIAHDDSERLAFYDIKKRDIHHCINWFYIEAKMQMMFIHGKKQQPPLEIRLDIMHQVKTSIYTWCNGEDQEFPSISFSISRFSWLPNPYRMRKTLSFTLTMEQVPDRGA
jgi:glycosyltransferase involved in cell wall biosynthesis